MPGQPAPYSLLPRVYILIWRTSPLARGSEFLSTLVLGLWTSAPPFASLPSLHTQPTEQVTMFIYIDDINYTSRPCLAQ
jgi:hypothetical protein